MTITIPCIFALFAGMLKFRTMHTVKYVRRLAKMFDIAA